MNGRSWSQLLRREQGSPGGAAQEALAIGMVGEGVVTLLMPRRHVLLWSFGPKWWNRSLHDAAEHTWLIRGAALASILAGIWWAWRINRGE